MSFTVLRIAYPAIHDEVDVIYLLLGMFCFTWNKSINENDYDRCEGGGELTRASRLVNITVPCRMHLCILTYDSSGSLLTPRSSTPHGAITALRCPSRWLSSIGFRVIGGRTEERGDEEGY